MISEEDESVYRTFMTEANHTERLYNVFKSSHNDLLKVNNYIGINSTAAGVLSTAVISKSTNPIKAEIGNFTGAISTYIGGLTVLASIVGDVREKNLEDAIYDGKFNICFRSQSIAGASDLPISSFTPWTSHKYVNKYYEYSENTGSGPYITRTRCEVIPFTEFISYKSEDGDEWEKF